MTAGDGKYLRAILDSVRVCMTYKPKFGRGGRKGLTFLDFQGLYRSAPFYSWFGLDNPMTYAALRAADGITSVYRQIGIGCERVFRHIMQDDIGLSACRLVLRNAYAGRKTRRLALDGRVPLEGIRNNAARARFHDWMRQSADSLGVEAGIFNSLTGTVFEVRQGQQAPERQHRECLIMTKYGRNDTDCVTMRRTGRQEMASKTLAAACVVWWFVSTTIAMAQAACNEWNTRAFFEKAATSDVTRCLAEFGTEANARSNSELTPLHWAAAFSKTPSVVAALLDAGADLKARSNSELTPLHWAAAFSKTPSVVAAFLDAGADLKARDEFGLMPLHMAAWFSKTPSVVAALLDAGADPGAKDAEGKIPWDLISDDSPLKGTDVYWRLNQAHFK